MAGQILLTDIRFGLDDFSREFSPIQAPNKNLAQEIPSNLEGRLPVKLTP